MKRIIIQFIPIIIVFCMITYSKRMAKISRTVLGKLTAIGLIIFYTSIDKILGLFVCSLVIFYYQFDSVEPFVHMDFDDNYEINNDFNTYDPIDDEIYVEEESAHTVRIVNNKNSIKKNKKIQNVKDEFKSKNCVNGSLKYKNMAVRNDVADFVFDEIKFNDPDDKCNVCSDKCAYSIIEYKMNKEDELRSLNSKP